MTVHIEAEIDAADAVAETRWLETLNAEHGLPTACIAQARLNDPAVEDVLKAQAASPLVRGIRHKPTAAASLDAVVAGAPGSMGDPDWRRGFALLERYGLSFDLQTPWWHLAEAAALATAFPRTLIVINHTALPADRSDEGLAGWRRALAVAAECRNVALKISGLGQKGQPWTLEANGPIIRDAIRIFGAERCLFASNFPVDSLCADFDTIYSGFREAVADMSRTAQRMLFHDNAVQFYRLA
jgi:predicted TIM-barrel fold metal-dependent hydrolase